MSVNADRYAECIDDLDTHPKLRFDPANPWWQKHFAMMRAAKEALGGDYRVNIPDLIENLDIYAAMRGPQTSLYDLMDQPEKLMARVNEIDETYFEYYDRLHELLKEDDGTSSYTAFHILGVGRVAKVQCDFSAMLSPAQFRAFAIPSLRRQVERLDHSLYHLDGPDAIRHVEALMEIERLDALQWTCGAGQPDGGNPRWFGIYDQVRAARKGLWVHLYDGDVRQWIKSAEVLLNRYGMERLYLIFPPMPMDDAEALLAHAQRNW